MNATAKTAAPAARKTLTAKTTKKTFGPADPVNLSLLTEHEGAFQFVTGNTRLHDAHVTAALSSSRGVIVGGESVPAGWSVIEADPVDGADAAVKYLRGIGADASRALLMKLFPKKVAPKTPKAPRTASVRVARNKIDDAALLAFIRDNQLTDARIQLILDSVRAAGCSASQTRVDKLLGRVTAA